MSNTDYDRGYEDGYRCGVEEFLDRYYKAVHAYDKMAESWNNLVAWLNNHYPYAMGEFEQSTAVAERMEKT